MVEVLLSVMNIKSIEQFIEHIKKHNIISDVTAVNQVDNNNEIFQFIANNKRIVSFNEKGASRSRNRLIELATGDICSFADDDMKYVENYEKIIKEEYAKNKEADVIIFFVENNNKAREKNKKIGNMKINKINCMRIRTSEITIKKSAIERIKENELLFNEKFGPGGIFSKGEETVFIARLLNAGFKIYSVDKKIGEVDHKNSTWFEGYNEKFFYDQGAIMYYISNKFYHILIFQYIIRKYYIYRKSISPKQAYKQMLKGVEDAKKI